MTASIAASNFLDPTFWLGSGGLFATAVLPGILIIVFIETGLLFPLLPGDTLLFAGGLLSAQPQPPVSIWALVILVPIVAVAGDQTAYLIGRRLGPALLSREDSRLFKKRYVERSHDFFDRHGPKTIILARFVPIVRTFTPVVAGISGMRYRAFLAFDVVGGIAWGAGVVMLGYFLGNVAVVKAHVELVVLLIAVGSGLPSIVPVVLKALNRRSRHADPPD